MYTPMVEQYLEIKGQHPDSILFFRLGDFYEMFFEDASTASRELEIVLTARDGGGQTRIPMCGVPYHSANHYIARLINRGYKVAICEQMEDPKNVKGIVKREVVRIITPGTLIEDIMLPGSNSNYLAAVVHFKNNYGLAYIDISTGEFMVTEFEGSQAEDNLLNELQRISPAECLVEENSEWQEKYPGIMGTTVITQVQPQENIEPAKQILLKQFNLISLESFGLEGYTSGLLAASAVLTFLEHTQKMNLKHIRTIKPYSIDQYLQMNFTTYKNLELTESLREGKKEGTLLSTLDYCLTSMGKREIKRWIDRPLMDVELINRRLQSVKEIKENLVLKEQIKQHLGTIYDLERLAGKLGSGLANPRDLLSIKLSAQMLGGIKNHLNAYKSGLLSWICQLDALTDVRDIIETSINDDAPATIKEGNIIKSGYNTEIDELRAINQQGAKWLVNFENQERTRTGIKNLKVGFNKVYGYYIEVSKANQHLVPPDYYRKQTLVNGERYVCEELKQYEEKLTTAHDRLIALEAEMFEEIRNRLALHIDRILDTANRIAVLDVLYSFAHAAYLHDYVMPEVDYSGKIEIKSGRHPVVENTIKSGFVPNDIKIDREERRFCLITGPNMGGKSTFMRQVALIVVMAQMGSFVPAEQAHIGVVDKIFTRVGASDDLAAGQSTFMVEMIEVASMLNNATGSSLIILDEIGRGTSTYDGLSLAYSVSEYIHEVIRAKTLFATHYHELTALADRYKGMINLTVAVKEVDNSVVFLKKVLPGKADKSYGIHVAKLAGLPQAVINRSEEILSGFEIKPVTINHNNTCLEQPGLFSWETLLLDELKSLNLDEISPKQALDMLYGWTTRLKIEQ